MKRLPLLACANPLYQIAIGTVVLRDPNITAIY
jgi:hypothetical protein